MNCKITSLLFLLIFHLGFSQKKDSLLYSNVLQYSLQFKTEPNLQKATLFFSKKKWDSTLVYSQKVVNIENKEVKIKDFYHYIRGISLSNKGILKDALKHLNLVSDNFQFINIKKYYVAYNNIYLQNYNEAIENLLELSKLPEDKVLYFDKTSIIHNLAISHLLLNEFNKAEFYFDQLNKNIKDSLKLANSYVNTANLYYNKSQNNQAYLYFKKAYNLSKKLNDFYLKRITAKNMAIIEENKNNYELSLSYRKEYEQWKDSLNDQNKIYAVAQKEKEFAVKQKQNEVDILQVQNELQETQRTIFLYAAIGLLILLGISLYFYREKVKRNKIIANQKENLGILNATKDKLFSIVSHDLRSSVNALKTSNVSLVKNLDSNNLSALRNLLQNNSAIVNGAYGLLDNLLNWALLQTNQGYFSISSLRLFFITEQVSFNYQPLLLEKELSFESSISKKDIVFADQESLKIVLRNLLDNAIKFSKPNGSIKIYTQNISDDYCDLIIEDTGLGMSETTRLDLLKDTALLNKKEHEDVIGTGLGLQLCKSMILKNNGKFSIESELGKGTKMIVSLPKNTSNE